MRLRPVLVVTYAWPPAGGPGVQRVLKFVKYLPEHGYRPIVLTVKDGTYPALDPSLERDVAPETRVVRTFSAEPTALYKRFVGMRREETIPVAVLAEPEASLRKRVANFVRLNAFVPDAKIGWLPWAVSAGSALVKEERPALVFSTAPPPTVHLVAKRLAKAHGLPWVADFRDPWTDIHYYEGKGRSWATRALDHRLERGVFARADRLTFVSSLDAEHYAGRYGTGGKHVFIPNGYDETDFESLPPAEPDRTRFTLMHLGSVGIERNPEALYAAIRTLSAEGVLTPANFQLVFVGKIEPAVEARLKESGILNVVKRIPYVPHREAVALGQDAHALLLLVTRSAGNDRILPGKTFEYLRHGRPLLALGPTDGEVARILRETRGGSIVAYEDEAAMTRILGLWMRDFAEGRRPTGPSVERLSEYSRRTLTASLSQVFSAVSPP